MNFFKSIFANGRSRLWSIVSVVLIAVMITVDLLANNFAGVISLFLGGDIPHAVDRESAVKYYETTTASKDEANEQARNVTRTIAEEGFILLKNADNALPVNAGAKVSVFGKNSVNLVYGGSGSGGGDLTFEKKTIFEGLTEAGFTVNPTLKSFYEDPARSGKGRSENSTDLDSGNTVKISTGETAVDRYGADVVSSYANYNDVALVVFSRIGGEGFDLPMTEANGAPHYLALDANERALLEHVKANEFAKIVVVLNTLNAMEAAFIKNDAAIDAAIWIGGPGSTGILALGDILKGKVTPSGHTTDTWAVNFKNDPTFNNFSERGVNGGDVYYNTDTGRNATNFFVKYEESVYVGYRYYETRAYEMNKASAGTGDAWYSDNVVFPFGYGLSYTAFDRELTANDIENVSVTKDGKYSVSVRVTNTGAYKGKDVVQVYATLPYTEGGVEKPYEVLVGFAKTPMLYPASANAANAEDAASGTDKPNSAVVTVEINPYDFASYDYKGKSGFKGYVLEAGAYSLRIASDAHTSYASVNFNVASDIKYDGATEYGVAATNLYTDCEDSAFNSDLQLDFLMSRSDLSVLPDAPVDTDRHVNAAFLNKVNDRTPNNPNAYTAEINQGNNPSVMFIDLVKKDSDGKYYADYDDPLWDELLNSLTVKEMADMFNNGGFKSLNIDAIKKPLTQETDGPVGWCNFISTGNEYKGNNAYCSQVVMSATWNEDLIEKMGEAVGEEALWGARRTNNDDGLTYSGWYAPGVNIHRSPFGGRNFEYFSEDPFLTGNIAAAEIQGCKNKGVYTYVKHFALNEQETHRNGYCGWVTEQAMREIYLKPFEFAVKKGKTTALMSSFNRIGTRWTGGDYRLLTTILRDEWGFKGTVICDYNQTGNYMDNKQQIYAGADLNLATDKSRMWNDYDSNSTSDVAMLRRAAKNVLYTVANSNALNGLNYKYSMATWKIVLIIVNIVLAVGIALWSVLTVLWLIKRNNPGIETVSVEE